MKIVWLGGSAPVINILYPPTQLFIMVYSHKYITLHLVNWLFRLWFSLNCSWTWLQQTFSEADKNGDGTLSIGEVHQLLHKLNVNLPKQKVREMFQVRLKRDKLNMNVTSNSHSPTLKKWFFDLKCIRSKVNLFKQLIIKEKVPGVKWMYTNQVKFIFPDAIQFSVLHCTCITNLHNKFTWNQIT